LFMRVCEVFVFWYIPQKPAMFRYYNQVTLKETYNKSGKVAYHQVNKLKKPTFKSVYYMWVKYG